MGLAVVVVEDEDGLREELCEFLRLSGMEATGVSCGQALFAHLESHPCDAVVLDINLPGEDGFRLTPRLRQRPGLGVVMVTSRAGLDDRVRGLKTGADAYMVKPIDLLELVATLESVCRRIGERTGASPFSPSSPPSSSSLPPASKGWTLAALGWKLVAPNGKAVPLTAAEHDFLRKLSATPGQAVSRITLMGDLPDPAPNDLRKLDAVVRRLRRKVEQETGLTPPIRAAHGVGYALMEALGSQ